LAVHRDLLRVILFCDRDAGRRKSGRQHDGCAPACDFASTTGRQGHAGSGLSHSSRADSRRVMLDRPWRLPFGPKAVTPRHKKPRRTIVARMTRLRSIVGVALVVLIVPAGAQQRQKFLYAALPGVGGGNNLKYGGAGILVFDIDHGHKFVKRIPLQGAPPEDGRQEAIKGIAAHAGTARLYVSTSRRVAAYDLLTDKQVWEQRYDNRGTDRIALSPDGTTIYAPELGAPKWVVADAKTGAMLTTIDKPGRPHNTQYSDDG